MSVQLFVLEMSEHAHLVKNIPPSVLSADKECMGAPHPIP